MWLLLSLSLFSNVPIQEIQINGAEKTSREEIFRITELSEGMPFEQEKIENAKSRLISSELFRESDIESVGCNQTSSTCLIKINLQEKQTWFVFPFFYVSEGNLGGGLVTADANLFGGQEKVFVVGSWGNRTRLGLLAYEDPYLGSSRWSLNFLAIGKREDEFIYVDRKKNSTVEVLEYGGQILPGYHLTDHLLLRAGPSLRKVKTSFELGNARDLENNNGLESGGLLEWEYKNLRNVEGLNGGFHFFQNNLFAVGDFDFFRQSNRASLGHLFFEDHWSSLTKFGFQWGRHLPFHRELTAGGTNLRGYLEKEIRGDMKFAFNQEVFFPLYRWNNLILRGIVFHDSQIVYFREQDFSRDQWFNGSGGGIRLYLRNVVVPLLGLDFARGWEAKDWGVYFNIGVPEGR